MKHISSILKINTILAVLFAALWLIGCTNDKHFVGPDETENGVRFKLEVPNAGIPKVSTRSMAGTGLASKEDEVKTVDVLVFDASSSPEMFLEWVQATDVSQDLSVSTVAQFTARLATTSASTRIVVVANKSLSSIASGFAGKNKAEVMDMLTHSSTGNWPANGASATGYTPIPMYGETVVSRINTSMVIGTPIPLTRMLARIDVLNSASNFTVEEVYLVNYNTNGYIAPGWDTNGQVNNASIPNIPSTSGKQTGESTKLTYAVNGSNNYVGEIYTFEAPAAADGTNDTDASRKDAVCLIVKGKIGSGTSGYYRIDFMAPGSENYVPLKRNYKYIVDIQQAAGAGHGSITEAINAYRVMSHLTVRLITYGSQEKIKSVVYNGQYMLGVGEPEIELYQYFIDPYTVDVYTDSPDGWKAQIPAGSWLTFSNGTNTATGLPNQDNSFSLRIPYYDAAVESVRTETITVTAGRLTHQVTVKQSVKEPGMIRFMDAYGNVLDNGLFFPMENTATGGDPEAQTIYVMWTTGGVESWLHPRADYGGDSPVQYVSFTPNIPDGDYGRATLSNGIQAITMQPKRGTEDWRWDIIYFNLFDDNNQYIDTKSFPINQGALTFKFYNQPTVGNNDRYALELGPVHTLDLGSNVNWEITKVEQIGNTGLLGTTDQDIRVGTSNMLNKPNVITNWNAAYGTDIVAQEGRYYLNFPTGDWTPGKTGTVRVTFRNLMHTAGADGVRNDYDIYERGPGSDDDYFPFFRTIDLVLTAADQLSYTIPGTYSYYYVNKKEYFNPDNSAAYMSFQTADDECKKLGNGWRIPSMQELMLSYIYVDALGGSGAGIPGKWFNNNGYRYWSTDPSSAGNYWGFQFTEPAGGFQTTLSGEENYQATLRCIRDQSSGTYPYLTPSYTDTASGISGTLIVSRDGSNGVNPAALHTTTGIPAGTANLVASKLLVENTNSVPGGNYDDRTWLVAQKTCTDKGTGWRLPTVREIHLIWLLGGTTETTFGGYKNMSWGTGFQKLALIPPESNNNGMTWTMSEDSSGNVYIINIFQPTGYYLETKAKNNTDLRYATVRCVKSIN